MSDQFKICYEILQEKQVGGQAIVNIVQDQRGKKFAQKKFHGEKAKEFYLQEKNILQILDHPNIIKLIDFEDNDNFLILEYIENKDLFELVQTEEISTERKTKFAHQILQSLIYLKQQDIAHRDIKLENILVDSEDNIKIIDFGYSCFYSEQTLQTEMVGSHSYLGPEIHHKKPFQNINLEKCEVFAFGVTVFSLFLTLFPVVQMASLEDKLYKIFIEQNAKYWSFFQKHTNQTITEEFKNLINKILCHKPEQRPTLQQISEISFFQNNTINNL